MSPGPEDIVCTERASPGVRLGTQSSKASAHMAYALNLRRCTGAQHPETAKAPSSGCHPAHNHQCPAAAQPPGSTASRGCSAIALSLYLSVPGCARLKGWLWDCPFPGASRTRPPALDGQGGQGLKELQQAPPANAGTPPFQRSGLFPDSRAHQGGHLLCLRAN